MPRLYKCGHAKTKANTAENRGNSPKCLICKRSKALNYYYKRKYGIDMRANYG